MALIADTGAIYAIYDTADAHHERIGQAIRVEKDAYLVPALVIPEVEYLLQKRIGSKAITEFHRGFDVGAFTLLTFGADAYRASRAWMERYPEIGIVDASVAEASASSGVSRILTVDLRHFRALRTPSGRPFTLVPWDE